MPPDEYDDIIAAATGKPTAPQPFRTKKGALKFQPDADWSLDRLSEVESEYQKSTGRKLPISVRGQGRTHDRWNYEHSNSADIGLSPNSKEGRALIAQLQRQNVPFLAFDKAIPGVSTGEHIHIGRPSKRKGATQDPYDDIVNAAIQQPAEQSRPQTDYDDVISAATHSVRQRPVPVSTGRFGAVRDKRYSRPLRPSPITLDAPLDVGLTRNREAPNINEILTEARESPEAEAAGQRREQLRAAVKRERAPLHAAGLPSTLDPITAVKRLVSGMTEDQDVEQEVDRRRLAEAEADAERQRLVAKFTPEDIKQTKDIADQLRRHGPGVKRGVDKALQGVTSSLLYKLAGLTEIPTLGQGDNPAGDWLRRKALAGELSIEGVANLPQPEREQVAEFLTGMVAGLPELIVATRIGGPIGGFAALHGTEAVGRGLPASKVAKETVKGGTLGAVFKGAGRLGSVPKELGAIGTGTAATELAFGSTPEEAAKSAGANLLFAGGMKAAQHYSNYQPRRQRGGGKGQFKRGSPSYPEDPSVPEAPETISAQLGALQQGTRNAVLVTRGDALPLTPQGFQKHTDPKLGTFIYDPAVLSRRDIQQKIADGSYGEILGHVEAKPAPGAPTAVVTARTPEGTEVQSSAVSPEKAQEQAVVTQAQNPEARVEVGGPELAQDIIRQRIARVGAIPPVVEAAERRQVQREFDKIRGRDEAAEAVKQDARRVEAPERPNLETVPKVLKESAEALPETPAEKPQQPSKIEAAQPVQAKTTAPRPVELERQSVEPAREAEVVKPWEMTRSEVEQEFQRKKAEDDNLEASVLGPELAKRYARLQRSANSSYDTKKADAAYDEIEKIEASLSETDRNRLYGIGETGPQVDTLREYRQSLGNLDDSNPRSLAESMRWAVSRVGNETDPLKMNHEQQVAYGTLREAARIAHENGWDTQAISQEAVKAAAGRFSDPEDAAFMLDRFLKKETAPTRTQPKQIREVINETTAQLSESTTSSGSTEGAGLGGLERGAMPAPSKPRGRDISDKTLAQAVRSEGGVRIDVDKANRGELARLSNRETGTTGLVNQRGTYNAEQMALRMAEEGFRGDWVDVTKGPHGPQYAVDGNKFLEAVEMDQRGIKPSLHGEKDIDFDTEVAKYYADQQKAYDAEISRTELLESGRGAELFDRITERKATDAERTEFLKLAKDRGVNEFEVEDLIAGAREETAGLEAPSVQRPTTARAEQLGFVEEGLRQQEAPPPKQIDQRERLIREEKDRQATANPERTAALQTLAELKAKGMTVDEYARQGSLLGETPSPERIQLLRELETPNFVRSARERQANRAQEKLEGIEYRRAGADPYELVDDIIVRGWELYSEKIKPTYQEWSRKIREEFGPSSERHLQKVWADLGGERLSSTAAKREKITEDRAARGEEPLPRPLVTRKSDERLLADAKAANEADRSEPMRLVDQVRFGKKGALSDKETVQLDLHVQELKNKYDAVNKQLAEAKDPTAIKELGEKSDAMEREMRSAEEAFAVSGTEKGRALRAQRIEIDQDFSLLAMVAKATKARGRELTTEDRTTIKEQHAKLEELELKLKESNERAEKLEAEKAVIKIKSDVARENRRAGRGLKRQSLDQEAAELKQLIAQAWKRQPGGEEIHSAMGLAKLDPEGVVTKLVVQLARNRVEAHIGLKAEALVDEVHGLLKDAVDLSRRDVAEMISGYGKTFEMSQDKVDTRLRELKSIIASNLGKADIIEKGIRPLRRGLQRDKPTQEVRAAMRDLRDTLREHGMQVERSKGSPEEQQKSALDAAKTRTRNRIEDLNKWIKDGKRTVANKTEIIPDSELQKLHAERDRLQKVFEAIDDPAADQRKIENALRVVNKSVSDLEAKITSGNIASKPRGGGPTSPELEAARLEQKALRGILTDLRNAAKPGPSDIEVEVRKLLSANNALTTRMEKQIADLERRMRQGDFSKPPKREPTVYNRENLALQRQLEQIKQEYSKANYKATRGRFGMITDELAQAANVPKTIKSMGDISAVFRQGGLYSLTHPVEGFAKPTTDMLRSFTEAGGRNVQEIIRNDPDYVTLKRAGTEFTGDKSDPNLSHKEEGYFGGGTIDLLAKGKYNIPGKALRGVKNFSERTYVNFLDSQRLHVGKVMLKGLTDPGVIARTLGRQKPLQRGSAEFQKEVKEISGLINIGTGRGDIPKFLGGKQGAPILNVFMFSPRLLASRVQLLNNMFNPAKMALMSAGARNQMIADNVKFLAATATVMQLAQAAGGTVSWDSESPDFLKIRFGSTTYDTLTGLQQPLRYIINMGRAVVTGEDVAGRNKAELTTRFARTKASPLAGAATDYLTGRDFQGREFDWTRAGTELVSPLAIGDFSEAMQREGLIKGFVKATPALTGIGVQTYDPKVTEKFDRKAEVEALKDRVRRGLDADAETAVQEGRITRSDQKSIDKYGALTPSQERFDRAIPATALDRFERMDAKQREEVLSIMERKAYTLLNSDALTDAQKEEFRERIEALGLSPSKPGRSSFSSGFNRSFRSSFKQGARP